MGGGHIGLKIIVYNVRVAIKTHDHDDTTQAILTQLVVHAGKGVNI